MARRRCPPPTSRDPKSSIDGWRLKQGSLWERSRIRLQINTRLQPRFRQLCESSLENEIDEPQKVLRPPLTEEDIAEVEEKLGELLPPDLKELVLIADGFNGGWHFAGGGWLGIKNSWKVPAEEYEALFELFPQPRRGTETKTREDGSTYEVTAYVQSITIDGSGNVLGHVWACGGGGRM